MDRIFLKWNKYCASGSVKKIVVQIGSEIIN